MRFTARLFGLATLLAPALVVAQTVTAMAGTPYSTGALSAVTTLGSDLVGLSVTATFAGGGTSSGAFANLGGGQYGVSNAEFMISIGAFFDTFLDPFTVTNNTRLGLTELTLRGAPGNVVFDRTFGGLTGTVGSEAGADFVFLSGAVATSFALYTNIVSVGATPAVGDLFESLIVLFGPGGLGGGSTLTFNADLDAAAVGSVVVPGGPGTVTPEPATFALMATGLIGLAAAARRNRPSA